MFYKLSPNMVHRGPMARQKQSLNLVILTLFSRSRRSFEMVSTQYLKYLICLHEILYTEAPGQGEGQDELGELDLIFKVIKAIQNGFRSISEEIFDVSSPNLVHRSTNARQRPSSKRVTLTSFFRSQRSF